MCASGLMEYVCICLSEAFYIGHDLILNCPDRKQAQPLVFSFIMFGLGTLFFICEILSFYLCLKEWYQFCSRSIDKDDDSLFSEDIPLNQISVDR